MLTDDEIHKALGFNEFTSEPTKVMLTQIANAAIAAYQTKLLAGVSIVNELQAWWDSGNEQYIELERIVQQYATAVAAQAREKALDEAKGVCESHWSVEGIAQRCYDDIDRLKGGE